MANYQMLNDKELMLVEAYYNKAILRIKTSLLKMQEEAKIHRYLDCAVFVHQQILKIYEKELNNVSEIIRSTGVKRTLSYIERINLRKRRR